MSLLERFLDETHEDQARRIHDVVADPGALVQHRESTNTLNLLIDLDGRTVTLEDDIGMEDADEVVPLDEFVGVVSRYLAEH